MAAKYLTKSAGKRRYRRTVFYQAFSWPSYCYVWFHRRWCFSIKRCLSAEMGGLKHELWACPKVMSCCSLQDVIAFRSECIFRAGKVYRLIRDSIQHSAIVGSQNNRNICLTIITIYNINIRLATFGPSARRSTLFHESSVTCHFCSSISFQPPMSTMYQSIDELCCHNLFLYL